MGVIYSNFEREWTKVEQLVNRLSNYMTEGACREAGKIAIAGKGYIVEDGDIMYSLFNV